MDADDMELFATALGVPLGELLQKALTKSDSANRPLRDHPAEGVTTTRYSHRSGLHIVPNPQVSPSHAATPVTRTSTPDRANTLRPVA